MRQTNRELHAKAESCQKSLYEALRLAVRVESQQLRVAQLEKELREKITDNEHLQTCLDQESYDHEWSQDRLAVANQELSNVKEELAQARQRGQQRSSIEDQELRRRHVMTCTQLVKARQDNDTLKNNIRAAEKKCASTNSLRQAKDTTQYTKSSLVTYKEKCDEQAYRVLVLENEIENQIPLVDVGVAIRLRFLEQARESVFDLSKADVDRCLIQDGNIAAHRANAD